MKEQIKQPRRLFGGTQKRIDEAVDRALMQRIGRPQASGYGDAGASTTRRALKGFNSTSGSPKIDIDWHNQKLRERGRMLVMSTPMAKSAIATTRTNVIGRGLQLKSKIDHRALGMTVEQADEWQRKTEKEFALWANNKRTADATGVNDFNGLQQLAFTAQLASGDAFALMQHTDKVDALHPYGLRVRLIEADLVRTPGGMDTEGKAENGNSIHDGVEVDSNGAIVAYYIHSTYPVAFGENAADTWKRVEAYGEKSGLPNVSHMMESERPGQYRGVTFLAPVIEPLLQIRRYTDSELTAANIENAFSAFIKTMADTTEMPFNEVGSGDDWVQGGSAYNDQVSTDPNEYELGPGTINVMAPGEDVTFANPTRPASGFAAFVEAIASQVGAALEIPRELLLKCFNSSYSASRAALLEAWKSFQMRRQWFTDDFCRPIYEVWLTEAIARGRISAPGFFNDAAIRQAYLGSHWIGPSQGMLDPTKEIAAEVAAIAAGFSTHEASTIKLGGGQWGDNVAQLEVERRRLIDAGLQKEEDTE